MNTKKEKTYPGVKIGSTINGKLNTSAHKIRGIRDALPIKMLEHIDRACIRALNTVTSDDMVKRVHASAYLQGAIHAASISLFYNKGGSIKADQLYAANLIDDIWVAFRDLRWSSHE